MKPYVFLLVMAVLLYSCSADNIQWFDHQQIEQVEQESDTTWRVQIGIHAQSFYLEGKGRSIERKLSLLKESLKERKKINVGVKKGTANIREVRL